MYEENKALVREFMEELWSNGNLAVIDHTCTPDFVGHDPFSPEPITLQGRREMVTMTRNAFPDMLCTVDDQIAEGDLVVSRWSARATHKGELMGIPATGKPVMTGINVMLMVRGKIVEQWDNWDALGMLQQLGVVPAPGQPAS